jgi:sec-independent protein translocase protein TatA
MHLALVLVIALLVFGPKKLPEIGKELGKAIREFKKASRDVMDSFHDALEDRPHPISRYDAPGVSAYYPSEDTFHQAAQASSLGEPATVAESPPIPGAAPADTVERPRKPPAAAAVEAKASPAETAPAAAPPGKPEQVGAGQTHGSADLPVGGAGHTPTA